MTGDDERLADIGSREEQQQLEADLVQNRIRELYEYPIKGSFDAGHLTKIHAYIFQDLPHHRPGTTRDDTAETWIKHRALEGRSSIYQVPYVSQGVGAKITATLEQFGGAAAFKGLTPDVVATRMAQLYGDLDYAHGFYEGNSRTLREFTRELAVEAGYRLDWTGRGVGAKERNALYVARDLAVLERAYPGLTPETGMQTSGRAEYEASLVLEGLRRAVGDRTLAAIIGNALGVEN